MNTNTVRFAIQLLAQRVGLSVRGILGKDDEGEFCDFIPADTHPNNSFSIRLQMHWRSVEARFIPGKFSAPLITQMGQCTEEARQTFGIFVSALLLRNIKITMRINGMTISPLEPENWAMEWSSFELSLRFSPFINEEADESSNETIALELVLPLFAMLATLIGVEEDELSCAGEPEGTPIQCLVTRYERKKINREACIQLKGTKCTVCGFDFAVAYGKLGEGYIEIHHTKPVSSIGPNYRINIATDLEPLCSNCHSIAHREVPPVPLDELRSIVKQNLDQQRKQNVSSPNQ